MLVDHKHNIVLALLVVAAFSVLIGLLLSLAGFTYLHLSPPIKYGIVFDAGSSHTSLFVYQWPVNKENNTGIVSQTHVCNVEGDGISSYAQNPVQAGASLRSCLAEEIEHIPSKWQRSTPIYLGATAGMRLLRLQNPAAADQILAEVTKTILAYPVNFQGAHILTGEEEGAFGWITINYLLESFMKYSFKGEWVRPISPQLLGAMDLGGASTQISFIPNVPIVNKTEEATFRLYGFDYIVYTHSYLCYGVNQALNRILLKIIKDQNFIDSVENPCYHTGYQENITLKSLYDSPCTATQPQPRPDAPAEITVRGSGNSESCKEWTVKLFDFAACSGKDSCSFDGVYQPAVTGRFFAFSAFYYTFSFLNLTSGQSLETVKAQIQAYCARDWNEIKASYPQVKIKWLRNYCGNGNYILTLLLDAYKFTAETWKDISFQKTAANADIGWTLGYMLNLTNMIPAEKAAALRGQDYSVWTASVFFIVLTFAICLILLYIYLK